MSMAVLVFSITHTKLLCHTDASVLQLSNEPELKPGSCFTSIIKFSAGRRVSHLDIKKDSRQTQKVLLCSHAGCVLQDLLHINHQSSSSSYKPDWNRGSISDLCPASAGACRETVSTEDVSNTHTHTPVESVEPL